MTTYSIRVIKVADSMMPSPHVFRYNYQDDAVSCVFYVWILQGGGQTIVIDTGMPQGEYLKQLQEFMSKFRPRWGGFKNVRSISEALASVGIQPEEVDHVLLSYMRVHATGGLEQFHNAQIFMSKRGWMNYWIPEFPAWHQYRSRDRVFTPPVMKWLITEAWERVNLVGEDEEILPGIRMFWAGVHHRSSMCISIETSKGMFTLCEPAFLYSNIEQNIPIGVLESVAEWHEVLCKLERIGGVFLPSHDPALLESYPDGIVV